MQIRVFLRLVFVSFALTQSIFSLAVSNYKIVDENHHEILGDDVESHSPLSVGLSALQYSLVEKSDELIGDVVFFRKNSDTESNQWSVKVQFQTLHSKSKVVTIVGHYEATGDSEGYGYGNYIADGYWVDGKKRKFISF